MRSQCPTHSTPAHRLNPGVLRAAACPAPSETAARFAPMRHGLGLKDSRAGDGGRGPGVPGSSSRSAVRVVLVPGPVPNQNGNRIGTHTAHATRYVQSAETRESAPARGRPHRSRPRRSPHTRKAGCVSIRHICVTVCAKRSDGPERRSRVRECSTNGQRPAHCRRPSGQSRAEVQRGPLAGAALASCGRGL